jgi:hypothetical protein
MEKRMSYGKMPKLAEFVSETEGHYPYPMELVGEDEGAVLDLGIDLHKSGFEEFVPTEHPWKLGLRVLDAGAMHRFLTKLAESENEAAGSLASAILGTLGYEWV